MLFAGIFFNLCGKIFVVKPRHNLAELGNVSSPHNISMLKCNNYSCNVNLLSNSFFTILVPSAFVELNCSI